MCAAVALFCVTQRAAYELAETPLQAIADGEIEMVVRVFKLEGEKREGIKES
jgi:hypothetical protein